MLGKSHWFSKYVQGQLDKRANNFNSMGLVIGFVFSVLMNVSVKALACSTKNCRTME